jgi:hypothetical protein
MKQGIIWAIVFAAVTLVVFPFIAPLVFRGSNMRQLGAAAFPVLLILGGGAGFMFGLARSRRKKSQE